MSNDGEEGGLKRSAGTWEQEERGALAAIPSQGSHPAQKVIHALILLPCDAGEFNECRVRGEALRSRARQVERVVELGSSASVAHETVRRVLKKTPSSRGGASAG